MKNLIKHAPFLLLYDSLLLLILIVNASIITHYYPIPQFSWDSYYYVSTGAEHILGIRPNGYAFFLAILHKLTYNIHSVAWVQFIVFYASVIFLLKAVGKAVKLKNWVYFLLGVIILTEPVALYHCNSILSDLLFSILTYLSLGCLLLYIYTKKSLFFILHVVFVFLCIEVRHIALFYPFFTCFIVFLFENRRWVAARHITIILAVYFSLYSWHIHQHKERYGVPIYSPFSGWTHANNALYASSIISSDAIKEPEIRQWHTYFKGMIAAKHFTVTQVGSGYLWDERSPLEIIRTNVSNTAKCDYTTSWFLTAPLFARYGTYIQKHFPMEYIKCYMIPNVSTLINPVIGEMGDYNITPFNNAMTKERYHLKDNAQTSPKQIYKDDINSYIPFIYKSVLILFITSALLFLIFLKSFDNNKRKTIFMLISFVIIFYGLTLYSSWFMFRYIIPIFPPMIITGVIVCSTLTNKIYSLRKKSVF